MKPRKSPQKNRQQDLFRPDLVKMIDHGHGLVKLANVVDWDRLDELFGEDFCPDNGRPAISTRLMVSLQYLKYTYNLSDDDVVDGIERKCPYPDQELQSLLDIATRIFHQQRNDKNKIYSVHEPAVECISKGKAHKRYEFGCKVSVAATSKGGWFVGAKAIHGNPYDGHTLKDALSQIERITRPPDHVFVDMGYRGHGYTGDINVHVDKRRRGRTAKSLWRWMKRRAAVEPGIGHLKREHRMDRCRLKGTIGDCLNAIFSAAGMNFRKLLRLAADFLLQFYFRVSFFQRAYAQILPAG
jgi:IS5 family transposase